MTLYEVLETAYMNHKLWEQLWLDGKTEWYPDSLGSLHRSEENQEKIDTLYKNKQQYVVHVDTGVHAFKIGYNKPRYILAICQECDGTGESVKYGYNYYSWGFCQYCQGAGRVPTLKDTK